MAGSVSTAYVLSGAFWISWLAAAAWSRRAASRPAFGSQTFYTILVIIGFSLLMGGGLHHNVLPASPLPLALAWLAVDAVAAGYLFCWWARLHLGSLWSGTVTTKEGHRLVD